jgi:hypothetical protein
VSFARSWERPLAARWSPADSCGRRLASLSGEPDSGPLDVWLVDDGGAATYITVSADWCLIVEEALSIDGYDMGDHGFVSVGPIGEAPRLHGASGASSSPFGRSTTR